jgi:hypothetical protein
MVKISRKIKYLSVITYEDPISKKEQISITIPQLGFDPYPVLKYLRENPRAAQLPAHETLRKIKEAIGFEDIKKCHAYRVIPPFLMGSACRITRLVSVS